MAPSHVAVLLMAYGSPHRLEEVEAYYTDIRGGRVPSPEAVEEAVEAGADRLIAIVLAPHYSRIGTGGYRRQVEAALASAAARPHRNGSAAPIHLDFVDSWHDLDGYLASVADDVRTVRAR